MRPLNSKERRVKFLLFVLLFVLSTLPLLVLVYQYGKLDVAENDFLREEYEKCQLTQSVKQKDQAKMDKVKLQVKEVRELLANKSSDMNALRSNNYAEIASKIKEIKINEVPLYDETDESLKLMVEDLSASLDLMNEVYRSGLEISKDLDLQKELLIDCKSSKLFGE